VKGSVSCSARDDHMPSSHGRFSFLGSPRMCVHVLARTSCLPYDTREPACAFMRTSRPVHLTLIHVMVRLRCPSLSLSRASSCTSHGRSCLSLNPSRAHVHAASTPPSLSLSMCIDHVRARTQSRGGLGAASPARDSQWRRRRAAAAGCQPPHSIDGPRQHDESRHRACAAAP
jgi:hypothetical protein